jgi:UDP-N-acetylmuramyl pentapeptide phosphotransferase/UDP-N-acetylglucosamine-1-phosphate transferase
MIVLPVALLLGVCLGAVLFRALTDMLQREVFLRTNYRGQPIPTSGGIVIVLSVFCLTAMLSVLTAVNVRLPAGLVTSCELTALAVSGFGLLGLLDDLAQDAGSSGYRGHVKSVFAGKLTAGSLKMIAGPAFALVLVLPLQQNSLLWLLIDGAIIALAANLANLFDRAPGRVTKFACFCLLGLVLACGVSAVLLANLGLETFTGLIGLCIAVGAACGMLPAELKERVMLGDTGANPLGAAIGLAVVLTQNAPIRLGVLFVLLFMNMLSERVSFSAVIERIGPLRALDRLGRMAEEP